MGISEAFYIPAALALITEYHTGATRSRATGLHQLGIYLGSIVGGFSGYAADAPALGWRWAFDVAGWTGMLYTLPLLLLLKDVPRAALAAGGAGRTSPWESTRTLFSNGAFVLLVLCFTLPALAGWIVRDWMPAILKAEFNIGQGKAGVSAALFVQVAAIAGALGGGWLADRWVRRTARGRTFVSAIGMALIVPALFGVGYSPATGMLGVAVAFLVLFGIGWGFFDVNNMPILCQIVPSRLRATGYGYMNLLSIGAGGLADWLFGAMLDHKLPLSGILGIFAAATAVSVLLMLCIRPRPAAEAGDS